MMLDKAQVVSQAQKHFIDFMKSKLASRKYFYWELDYFKRIDNLTYQSYEIPDEKKDYVNTAGASIFSGSDKSIVLSLKKNSIRNDLHLKNVNNVISSTAHIVYLQEFVLFHIINSSDVFSDEIKSQQELNFIYSFLQYALKNNITLPLPDYRPYSQTSEGQELFEKLDKIIADENDVVKQEAKMMQERVKTLMIRRDLESKLSFLYIFPVSEDKEELRFALEKLSNNQKELYFRGQADSNWKLESSVTRSSNLMTKEYDLFQDIITLRPREFSNDKTDYEKLITMQHFGLPTRLLDITRNPLVAIFFACNNLSRKDQDGMVYIFEDKTLLHPDDKKVDCLTKIVKSNTMNICNGCSEYEGCSIRENSLLKENHFVKGVANNQRINNQSGDFIFEGLGESSKKNENLESEPTRYLIIDYQVKPILLENLQAMNIHGGSVYPDLSNMSNYLANKYRNGSTIST